jgi:hypothetical protein
VLFAQIAPAAACAIFDGPGKPGCPAAFSSFSSFHSQHDPDGKTGDCADGPSYLSLDVELQPSAPPANSLDDMLPIGFVSPRNVAIEWRTEGRDCIAACLRQTDDGRQLYLSTLRLRL